ncbi:hypothetical protein [Methanoculleus taiwanensis]|uniref:hypothetical protein n=1 Tax=Methanoculleus taiwanensis TaxID=1550565 RepID=UPI000FFF1515|nr:hypothetical protein [Methanoculleus taiwanensis]
MRTELQPLEGQKSRFVATFERYGIYRSRGIVGRSILLRNLKTVKGRALADHIWINYTAGFDAIGEFARGDVVQFTAGVRSYFKGYFGQRIEDRLARKSSLDYRLTFPRNVVKISGQSGYKTMHLVGGKMNHKSIMLSVPQSYSWFGEVFDTEESHGQ